jgi:two-component system, NarL family, invasion response regulator UvrY
MEVKRASGPEHDREKSVRVMVVDDQPSFRRAAQALVNATSGFQSVGEAASGAEALRRADQLRPALVLIDVYLPEMDGFETARRLTDARPDCVVVLVSLEDLEGLAPAVASSGAAAIVRKEDLEQALLRDLWKVHGRHMISDR